MDKEELLSSINDMIEDACNKESVDGVIDSMKDLKIHEKYYIEVLTNILNKAMERSGKSRSLVLILITEILDGAMQGLNDELSLFVDEQRGMLYGLIIKLVKEEFFTQAHFLDCFRNTLDDMEEKEATIPRIKSYVAAFGARSVCEEAMTLAEIAECTDDGRHFPFLLLVLQHLGKMMDKHKLCRLFDDSKVKYYRTENEYLAH
jgi:hypothetical protein